MTEITFQQLSAIVYYLSAEDEYPNMFPVSIEQIFDPILIDICANLSKTGLRYNEIADISNFYDYNGQTIKIKTSKGSNPITVYFTSLTPHLRSSILSQSFPYQAARYSTFTRWIEKALGPWQPYTANKKLSAHLFRHFRFKQLNYIGKTIPEISEITGEIDPMNITRYIESKIYRKP